MYIWVQGGLPKSPLAKVGANWQVSEFSSEFPFVSEICTQGSGFLMEFAARRENVFKNHEPEMPPGPLLARSRIAPGSILVEKPLVLQCVQPLPDRSRIHFG